MSEPPLGSGISDPPFQWTPWIVFRVASLFLLAGLAELGGGWMVWKAVRGGRPWWWALLGSIVLVAYGFIPTLQPLSDFGRLYAVYGAPQWALLTVIRPCHALLTRFCAKCEWQEEYSLE